MLHCLSNRHSSCGHFGKIGTIFQWFYIPSTAEKDAGVNAVIVLDVFAKELPFTILSGLEKMAHLYDVFIETDEF